MKKHETVRQATAGQMKEFAAAVIENLPFNMTADDMQAWIGNKGILKRILHKAFMPPTKIDVSELKLLLGWEEFYHKIFGLEKHFSDLVVPEKQEGFNRLIVVAEGMTPERIFGKIKELMPAWKYSDNLDQITSDRKTDKDYAIWVRDRVEADEELKNKSANDLKMENIPGITLEERLLYELKFFDETGKHLDIDNWTLCTGSRRSDGLVPSVFWFGLFRGVEVYWCHPDYRDFDLRSRAVVS